MAQCSFNPASPDYADFIYHYTDPNQPLANSGQGILCMEYITYNYAVVYVPLKSILPLSLETYSYYSIPNLYTLLDTSSMEAAGIQATLNTPAFSGGGRGVIVGLIDTGIDYTNPLFRNPDGTTRLAGLWDQTLPEDTSQPAPGVPEYFPLSGINYGTEFTEEELNRALASDDPFSLVPSRDGNGHGTFLAGIAAGGYAPDGSFNGAAPNSRLAVVKLKEAKAYLRDFFLLPSGVPAYQENDIMMGVKYLQVLAHRLRMPLVVLLGLGSNFGSHDGQTPLGASLKNLTQYNGFVTVTAAGNETGLGHHYEGSVAASEAYEDVEIRVGSSEQERGFVLELWAANTDTYAVGFISPGGETIRRIERISGTEILVPFTLEPTKITVSYLPIEPYSGRQLIFIRMQNPTAGIWRIRVYNSLYYTGSYNIWLPADGFISSETVFLRPTPYTTLTLPADSESSITVSAYNHANNSIYIHSSRGFTLSGQIKPDLAAPGVNVYGPALRSPSGEYPMTRRTGTSVAAAHVAGAAANLLGWGIAEGNDPNMGEAAVRAYLIRQAGRNPALTYPNREWGYGTLNLYEALTGVRE